MTDKPIMDLDDEIDRLKSENAALGEQLTMVTMLSRRQQDENAALRERAEKAAAALAAIRAEIRATRMTSNSGICMVNRIEELIAEVAEKGE